MRIISIVAAAMLITSCTTMVTPSQIGAATYPAKPSEQEAEAKIRGYLTGVLKDPESLRLECESTRKGWARQYRDRAAEFGWVKPCMANAKNSFGGYAGAKPYIFLFSTSGFKALDGQKFRAFSEHVGFLE